MLSYEEVSQKAKEQMKENELKIKKYLEGIISFMNPLPIKVEINSPERLYTSIYFLDKEGKEIFGSEISMEYSSKHHYISEDSIKALRLNTGSCGTISREENIGAYYRDILKGQIWINEKDFVSLLETLDFSYSKQQDKMWYEEVERLQREKKEERNKIIKQLTSDYIRIGKQFTREENGKVLETLTSYKLTEKRIYFKSTAGYNIYIDKDKLINMMSCRTQEKEELDTVNYIIRNGHTC